MIRLLRLVFLVLCLSIAAFAQVHIYPALDTNNVWTGTNTFAGPVAINGSLFPLTPGSATLGTPLNPFSSIYIGNAATNNIQITGISTGPRVLNLPDANSTTVQISSGSANQFVNGISSAGVLSYAIPTIGGLTGNITLAQTPLTTRGDLLVVGVGPALGRLALGGSNLYLKSNGTDTVFSTLAAGGVGTCTNQVVTQLNADAAPTCTTLSLASTFFSNQGTTTTVLHGNAAGIPAFGSVAPGDTTGSTGSGSVFALQTSPSFVTPVLGAATGTSLNLGATGVLSTTAQSGTGSICMTTNCVLTTPTLGAATGTSLNLGATGVLSTTAQSGTGSICMTTSCVMATPNIGAASGSSLNLNAAATASGAVLTLGGTSSTTGGISIFVGAAGSATERAAIYPADGSTAATRVGALSIRTVSAGFLTGAETAGITAAGQHLSNGTLAAPAHSYESEPGSGWFWQQAGIQALVRLGAQVAQVGSSQMAFANGYSVSFSSGAPQSVAADAGISRFGVGILAIGNSTAGDVSGTIRVARNGSIRHAEDFAGADCGAKINAAGTDLGGLPGEIWVSQLCGTTFSTAITTPNNVTMRLVQGGTYSASAAITLGQASGMVGSGCGGNLCSTIIQEATGANLPALVNGNNQSFIYGIELDGNKTNNPTGGVGVQFPLKQQPRMTNAIIQNFKSFGVSVSSTLSGDEAVNPVFDNVLIFNNDGGGLNCISTTDGFLAKVQFEQNGLGPQNGTVTTVNTSGTTVTWVSGPKWSTDSSLIGTLIRLSNSASTLFQVTAIASTTSLTVSATPGTLTGANLYWGDGVFSNNCPGWRYEHSDFGGNGNDGLLMVGSDTGRGSSQNMVVGNEFGGNRAHDFEKRGFGTAAFVATQNTISANVFLGSVTSIANTFSGMYMQDPNLDSITGNIFSSANRKFGVDFEETAVGRAQKTIMTGNTFASGFGTAIYSTATSQATNALAIFANAEGPTGAVSFGAGPSSMKFQGGIVNSGTGFMHVRVASCTTTAAANGQCTTTVTWPGTWNDVNYTPVCILRAPTNPAGVVWLGGTTTTTVSVQILNLAGSALAASGEIDCVAVHD